MAQDPAPSVSELVEEAELTLDAETKKRLEWLSGRNDGVGASEAAVVMGLRPFEDANTPLRLWMQKCELIDPPDLSDVRIVQTGIRMEKPIADTFADRYGVTLRGCRKPVWSRVPDMRWMYATPDRFIVQNHKVSGILECKNPANASEWGREGSDDIPHVYRIQTHQQMLVTQFPEAFVAAHIFGDIRIYPIKFDPKLANEIIEAQRRFWTEHVLPAKAVLAQAREHGDLPATPLLLLPADQKQAARERFMAELMAYAPAPLGLDDVRLRHAKAVPALVRAADDETLAKVREIVSRQNAMDAHEAVIETLKADVATTLGDAEELFHGKNRLATFKNVNGTRRVDLDKLRAEFPEAASQCEVLTTPTRRFEIDRKFKKELLKEAPALDGPSLEQAM